MPSEATPTVWMSPVEPLFPFLNERRKRIPLLDEIFALPLAEADLSELLLNLAFGEAVISGPERADVRSFIADLAQLTHILEHPVALKLILPLMLTRVTASEVRAATGRSCAGRARSGAP